MSGEKVDEAEFGDIKVELRYTENEQVKEGRLKGHVRKRYSVLVKTDEGQESFTFHGSVAGFQEGTDPSVEEAFRCVLEDAMAYHNSEDMDDLQQRFGYEKASKVVEVWNGVKKTAEELEEIGLGMSRVHGILRKLDDME